MILNFELFNNLKIKFHISKCLLKPHLKLEKRYSLYSHRIQPTKADKKKRGKQGVIEEEGASENMDQDDDLMNLDQNNMQGFDQEQLTAEEKAVNIIKTLTANNPLAAHNLTKYSFKERAFKTDDYVDHLVFHFQFDGDVVLKESDEARDQEEYWENKKKGNKSLLDKMNIAIKEEFGKDPRKFTYFKFKLQLREMTRPRRNHCATSSTSRNALHRHSTCLCERRV